MTCEARQSIYLQVSTNQADTLKQNDHHFSDIFKWISLNENWYCSYSCYFSKITATFPRGQWVNSSPPGATYIRQWVNKASIGSVNGFSLLHRKAITWTNAGLLTIGLLGTNFSEIKIGFLSFSLKEMHLKLSSANMAAIMSRGTWINI